ncbi:MAG: hypothetical protein MJZ33_01380 [Paludibacteraceae bacterium]|nr:hypothetical protein [Paludibacteraceae bacterium]
MNKIIVKPKSLLDRLIQHTKWYNDFWGGALEIYNLNTFGLQVVNLGSGSAVHNFNYSGLNLKCFNFALGPQSLLHDFNIIKNYFSYFAKGCTILIPVCPFSGMVVKYDSKHNFKYYPILHPATIPNFDDTERTRAYRTIRNPFSVMPSVCVKNTLFEILRGLKHKIVKTRSGNLQASADSMMTSWKMQFSITDLYAPISEQHVKDINCRKGTLGEMLDFCLERGFKPVVVMPAMHPTLHKQIPTCFDSQYIAPLLEEAEKRGVACLDYMRDERFENDNYYLSALFMNEQGAKAFTKQVLKDLTLI